MKNLFTFILFLGMLGLPLSLPAQTVLQPETKHLLKVLDEIVNDKSTYRKAREEILSNEKRKAEKLSGSALQKIYHHIFKEYSRYQTDSALVYLNKMSQTPPVNEDLIRLQRIGRAEIYAVTGSYAEAEKLLKQVDSRQLNDTLRLEYYHISRTLYGWMAAFSIQTETRKKMQKLTSLYRDSILRYEQPGINRDIVLADSANVSHRPDIALEISLRDTAASEGRALTFIHYNLAVAYALQGNKDRQMFHLAQTAIGDLKSGTTEYEALPRLAMLCYEMNDIDRAYRYLVCSMEDAGFCKARLRSIEASNIFPIIDRAYKEQEEKRGRLTDFFTSGLVCLALLLVGMVVYLRRQMRRLSATRKELAAANSKLQESNQSLRVTDKVKEEYIARYLGRCRTYIDTLENFRHALLKRFKAHQMEELYKELKSEETVQDEQRRLFEEFDSTFLNLCPNFVSRFNELLQPEARIHPKDGELLTTELRIFALIRLGITDSQRIAHFLNYSVATIYCYRSKIRNKAVGDKNEFEAAVMKI